MYNHNDAVALSNIGYIRHLETKLQESLALNTPASKVAQSESLGQIEEASFCIEENARAKSCLTV